MFQWDKSCSYDEQQKKTLSYDGAFKAEEARRRTQSATRQLRCRSNKAGMAVSGEVTLHHACAYIQVGQFGFASGHGILIRTCKGRKDYIGGPNHFVDLTMLDDISALAAAVRAITGIGRQEPSQSRAAQSRAA